MLQSLDPFITWARRKGYHIVVLKRPHPYEVLRLTLYDPQGDHPHLVYYRRKDKTLTAERGEARDLLTAFQSTKTKTVLATQSH